MRSVLYSLTIPTGAGEAKSKMANGILAHFASSKLFLRPLGKPPNEQHRMPAIRHGSWNTG
jgi:hypothetical protein